MSMVLVCFSAAIVAHAILCRARIPGNSVVKFLAGGLLAGSGLIVQAVRDFDHGGRIWPAIFLYGFICELYIFLFTFVGTSVSASLLFNLNGRALSMDEMDQAYSSGSMVERRIKKLAEEGLLEIQDSGPKLTGKGQRVVKLFRALQRLFGHYSNIQMPRSSKMVS